MQKWKSKSFRKISSIVAVAIAAASSQPAQATLLSVDGRVNNVIVFDQAQNQAAPSSFSLVGVSSLGSCPTILGLVFLRLKEDVHGQRMYAAVLSAAASGSMLSVNVDDTIRDSGGFCYVKSLSFEGN
jgi:hypothetical protein